MASFNTWLDTFLEEKELPSESWEIEAPDGTTHYIDSDVVIEAMHGCSKAEQEQIKSIIVRLDFANALHAEFMRFFHHLAQGLVSNH